MGNGGDCDGKTVDVYGPLGLRKLITTNLELSRSPLPYRFCVHEMVPVACQYPADWAEWPVKLEWDSLVKLEQEARRIERAPDCEEWALFDDGSFHVAAGPIMHRIPSFAFVITGKDQPGESLFSVKASAVRLSLKSTQERVYFLGALDAKKLREEFNLPPGPLYAKLKRGESVVTEEGRSVVASEVLGPPKRGKKVQENHCSNTRWLVVSNMHSMKAAMNS